VNPADLKQLSLFDSLDEHEVDRLSKWATDLDFPAGHHVVDQGEVAWEFFVILDGQAQVLRDGDELALLGPGDFFGEMALEAGDRRNASVVATTPLRLAVMLGRDYKEMEQEMPHVAEAITSAITKRTKA
jgi:CRP/FNR family transcriptional regulator, cyclic AMP receptor protein